MILENYSAAVTSADNASFPPPDGDYVLVIKSVTEKRGDDGSPYTGVGFNVEEGEYAGRNHYERYQTATEFGAGKFETLRRAAAVPVEKLPGNRASVDLGKFIGRKVNGKIRTSTGKVGTKGEGKTFTNLVSVGAFDPEAVKSSSTPEPWAQ